VVTLMLAQYKPSRRGWFSMKQYGKAPRRTMMHNAAIISTATNTFEGFRQFGSIASKTTSSRIVPTTVERKMTAAKAMKMQKTFSTDVTGRRSPYPTVASVTMAK